MKQTILKTFMGIAGTALLFAACNDDDNAVETQCIASLQINVSAEGFTGSGVQTRASDAGYRTSFVSGDRIGITAITGGSIVPGQDNIAFEYDGTDWNLVTSTDIILAGADSYIAYYPYDPAMTGMTTTAAIRDAFTPKTDQSDYNTGYTVSDLMTGTGAVSGATLNVTVIHALALVEITLPSVATSPAFVIGGSAVTPYVMPDGKYRYLVKPANNVRVSSSYLSGTTPYTYDVYVRAEQGKYVRVSIQ